MTGLRQGEGSMEDIRPNTRVGGVCAPEDLVLFAPGQITAEGDVRRANRRRMFYREFTYKPQQATPPGIDSILMVVYRHGETRMRRRAEANWCDATMRPGKISLLAARQDSDWEWESPISVSHFYISTELMGDTAAAAFDRDYAKFEMRNTLDIDDGTLLALADTMANEIRAPGAASLLLIDSLSLALSLHLLRAHHTDVERPLLRSEAAEPLTPAQRRRVVEYVEAHLAGNMRLAEIARAAGQSETILLRNFKATFGTSPHQYFIQRRIDRATDLIRTTTMSLAEVACVTGFSDQAHMSRLIKRSCGVTPGAMRRN